MYRREPLALDARESVAFLRWTGLLTTTPGGTLTVPSIPRALDLLSDRFSVDAIEDEPTPPPTLS